MLNGPVTTWFMTEEERLAYIAKHPIKPSDKPKGSSFVDVHSHGERSKQMKRSTLMDKVDKDEFHRLYMLGHTQESIAKNLNISVTLVNNHIERERKAEPEKWPYRLKRKGR
ncbi:hypothetical protein [Metabacillus fastidiosus]|uniref:hypothetical protein n=1 Tax=Metabacillus fastidiosus TaxID=1458 RepID=UPI003D2DB6F0